MKKEHLRPLLEEVARGRMGVTEAAGRIAAGSFVDLGEVTLDLGRQTRTGTPEVIFGEGKDERQLEAIARSHRERSEPVLFTRLSAEQAKTVRKVLPKAVYAPRSRTLVWPRERVGSAPASDDLLVVSAGASDARVAEEVAVTARFLGFGPKLVQDCGVAGLHRLLARLEELRRARVVVAVAGMDGALPTVVAGLIHAPVIAVPTSVGYGPGGGGLTPLLTMLSSCAPGLVVVNVDNGVGAAFAAARMLALVSPGRARPAQTRPPAREHANHREEQTPRRGHERERGAVSRRLLGEGRAGARGGEQTPPRGGARGSAGR